MSEAANENQLMFDVIRAALKAQADDLFEKEMLPRMQKNDATPETIESVRNIFVIGYTAGVLDTLDKASASKLTMRVDEELKDLAGLDTDMPN